MLTLATIRNLPQRRHPISTIMAMIVLLALLVALIPNVPRLEAAPRAQPELIALAQRQPHATIGVIVRKDDSGADIEQRIAQLGGTVTMDLQIINAFAAKISAGAALELARSSNVRWVSLDAPMVKSGGPDGMVNTSKLLNTYNAAIGADRLWAEGYQGSSATVAVLDSGISDLKDFKATYGGNGDLHILTTATIVGGSDVGKDWYGHGTHVAGIIGGNGTLSHRRYIGIAPKVKLVAVDVTNEQGAGTTADVIAGLQWLHTNRAIYNIRVVNISLNASVAESYHTSPLDAAVEILWFSGIVVVVSAGNNASGPANGILFPPANDPFVITVGATDDQGTPSIKNDTLASFSAYGITESGFAKPDLVAPGTNIISTLSKQDNTLALAHPDHKLAKPNYNDYYFRMSGTSMAAPMVSGAVALLLQDEPNLTPDQVKYRLKATANKAWPAYNVVKAGAGYLDAYAAVKGTTMRSANTGVPASQLLWSGSTPVTWNSVNWNSVNWNSVNWNSVNWNSVNWNSVNWNSDFWGN
jgi:serine protease AprX